MTNLFRAFILGALITLWALDGHTAANAMGTPALSLDGGSGCASSALATSHCTRITMTGLPSGKKDGADASVANATVNAKVTMPTGTPVGTIIFCVGGGQCGGWEGFTNSIAELLQPLVDAGYVVIQPSFNITTYTGTAGPRWNLARAATAFEAIYNNTTLHPAGTKFGCVGQSGGSSLCAYPLVFYGFENRFNVVVFGSGPPISFLGQGCVGASDPAWVTLMTPYLQAPGASIGYTNGGSMDIIDDTYTATHCTTKSNRGGIDNPGFRDGLDNGAGNRRWPNTNCHLITGSADSSEASTFGRYFLSLLTCANTPTDLIIQKAGHTDVQNFPETHTAIYNYILNAPSP